MYVFQSRSVVSTGVGVCSLLCNFSIPDVVYLVQLIVKHYRGLYTRTSVIHTYVRTYAYVHYGVENLTVSERRLYHTGNRRGWATQFQLRIVRGGLY